MNKKIILASNNQGKLREICCILQPYSYDLISQAEYSVDEISETGLTFVENAILKARHAAQKTELPALADDSGLVVDALDGRPGIYSSRFAGENATDQMNIEKLLAELGSRLANERQASFYCVMVLMQHPADPTPIICQGRWRGEILFSPRGKEGFGYDPIFYVPELKCSAAELSPDVKNKLSHRAQALRQLVRWL